jgi:indole-3-glycerol phosphate synthase
MAANLDTLVIEARLRVADAKRRQDRRQLELRAERYQARGFGRVLRQASQSGPAVIAELKKASPSRGVIRSELNVARLASELANAGASALSVLTEERHFQGSLENLRQASTSAPVPCLRKDFIVDEFQLLESRANCADAVLLIAAALSQKEFQSLRGEARRLGLDVLAEVHNEEELQRVLDAGCDIVGVNSRDLRTFQVDLEIPTRLATRLPASILRIAESGIASREDLERMRNAGYDGFLIGESLMKAADPAAALRQMLQVQPSAIAAET